MRRAVVLWLCLALAPSLAHGAVADATVYVRRGAAARITFPIYDGNGQLVLAAASLDSECAQDEGAKIDCTNEATAYGDGYYYLDLTAAETTCNTCRVIINTSSATPVTAWVITGGIWDTPAIQVSPVSASGTITLRRGADYNPADGTASTISISDTTGIWPTFAGSTPLFVLYRGSTVLLSTAATVASADTLTVTITAAQTAALAVGTYTYRWEVTLATSARVVYPGVGPCAVVNP